MGWLGLVSQMWTCCQDPHLPSQCHFPQAICSLSHDVVWPLRWLRNSGDIGCRLALACNALFTSGWPQFLHFGFLCHTNGKRLTWQSDKGHLGDECLSGPWPLAILRVSRLLGFHEYQSLVGWQMWSCPKRDQIDHVRSHGQNGGGSS